MATVKFTTFGGYSFPEGNATKTEVITSINTWSLVTNVTVGITLSVDAATIDKAGNYFVGISSTIYKYNSSFALVSDWGTSGKAYITSLLVYEWRGPHLAVNVKDELFVIYTGSAGSAINCWAFDSAGISVWAKSTITTVNSPFTVAPLGNGNIVMGGGYGTVVGLREYSRIDGSYIKNYSAISDFDYQVCTNSIGDIFAGPQSLIGYGPTTGYKFTTGNSIASWSVVISGPFSNSVMNSAYIFALALSTTGSGLVQIINKSTGIVTAFSTTAESPPNAICLSTVPNVFIIANVSSYYILDNTATILAQQTTQSVTSISSYFIVGASYPGFNVQTPRALTYQRKLLAFACNQIWAEVTA